MAAPAALHPQPRLTDQRTPPHMHCRPRTTDSNGLPNDKIPPDQTDRTRTRQPLPSQLENSRSPRTENLSSHTAGHRESQRPRTEARGRRVGDQRRRPRPGSPPGRARTLLDLSPSGSRSSGAARGAASRSGGLRRHTALPPQYPSAAHATSPRFSGRLMRVQQSSPPVRLRPGPAVRALIRNSVRIPHHASPSPLPPEEQSHHSGPCRIGTRALVHQRPAKVVGTPTAPANPQMRGYPQNDHLGPMGTPVRGIGHYGPESVPKTCA